MEQDIFSFLQYHAISYERFDHPAVFTCEEAEKLCPQMPGNSIKNMFLYCDKKDRYFLVVVSNNKRVDLKKLKGLLGVPNLRFGSEERLKRFLGVDPGSVTLLGLVNDSHHKVDLIFDEEIWGGPLQCHPLVNTQTLILTCQNIERFLQATGHQYQAMSIPHL